MHSGTLYPNMTFISHARSRKLTAQHTVTKNEALWIILVAGHDQERGLQSLAAP